MIKKENMPVCPVATTIQLIGGKWKLFILKELLTGTKRYGELEKSLIGISKKILTASLKDMVEDGIVMRTAYETQPPRVEYRLTDVGESMRTIIDAMAQWGTAYKENKRA